MAELGVPLTAASIAAHYAGLIDGLVIDTGDAAEAAGLSLPTAVVPTLMQSLADRERLAGDALSFAASLTRMPARQGAAR